MPRNHSPAVEPDSAGKSEPQLQVVVHAGPLAGKGFVISGDSISFGRDPNNQVSWEDSQVSRYHAKLERREGRLILEDLGSTNGTLVNGKPITGEHILQPADIISIGSSVFGVKGFVAPLTVGITQISSKKPELASAEPDSPAVLSQPKAPSPRPQSPPPHRSAPPQSGGANISMLAVGAVLLISVIILGLAALTAYYFVQEQNRSTEVTKPTVIITAPVAGSRVSVGQPTMVQATASDPSGVVRIELWISGVKTTEVSSPATQGQATLTASMQWIPQASGSYTLEVKAYNTQNRVNEPTTIAISAIEAANNTPTVTPTPENPAPTLPSIPLLTTRTDLNVRLGPGTFYDLVGLLPVGATAEVIGRDERSAWWQVRFEPALTRVGWVSANPEFSTTVNVGQVPVVQAPPTPTGTPTQTPTSTSTATGTPTGTNTPLPPTQTPTVTATPSPTQANAGFEFNITPTTIQGGECVQVTWNIFGVKEIYYQNQGVGGTGNLTECPAKTTTFTIRVVRQNDAEYSEDITVEVIEPIASQGKRTLNLGDTIDFDAGGVPGDDFVWRLNDEFRRFEALEEVLLSPQAILNSLDDLPKDDCLNANYDDFTYLDGSDAILNPANELTDGRTACFFTNQGRYGKMRFPQFSTEAIEVEWLTWQQQN